MGDRGFGIIITVTILVSASVIGGGIYLLYNPDLVTGITLGSEEQQTQIKNALTQIQQAGNNVNHFVQSTTSNIDAKPAINIPELEQKIHLLINAERQKSNISELTLDITLSNIARAHSQDMANRMYFEHNTPEGQDPTARGESAGYHCHKDLPNGYYTEGLAENIFQNNLYNSIHYINNFPSHYDWNDMDALASSTVEGWMNSAGHRANILNPIFDTEGIGVAISSDDKVYITEDFC